MPSLRGRPLHSPPTSATTGLSRVRLSRHGNSKFVVAVGPRMPAASSQQRRCARSFCTRRPRVQCAVLILTPLELFAVRRLIPMIATAFPRERCARPCLEVDAAVAMRRGRRSRQRGVQLGATSHARVRTFTVETERIKTRPCKCQPLTRSARPLGGDAADRAHAWWADERHSHTGGRRSP